jgi:hypothetical protein
MVCNDGGISGIVNKPVLGRATTMKMNYLYHGSSRQLVEHLHEIHLIREPFSDHQILHLQEKFLTNGFQYLKASNVVRGRAIIQAFLDSLHVYHETACLSLVRSPVLPEHTSDLYETLYAGGYLSSFEPYSLDEFFLENFYYDFMWIEATRDLLITDWFDDVIRKLIDQGIDHHIPIIVVVYEQE